MQISAGLYMYHGMVLLAVLAALLEQPLLRLLLVVEADLAALPERPLLRLLESPKSRLS